MSIPNTPSQATADALTITGAREHNLAGIDVAIPHHKFTVVTGVSGSGKSSLLNIIASEGHRRYLATLESNYARNFMGSLQRPDIDKITGLQPIISIAQETYGRRNLRSTIGTLTGIYAFLRLLYARAATAYSYLSGIPMVRQSVDQIEQRLLADFQGKELTFLAPLVRGRKGHYRELFTRMRKLGYLKVYVDGIAQELKPRMEVDRYKNHDIAVVIGTVVADPDDRQLLREALQETLYQGKGTIIVQVAGQKQPYYFSRNLMDPTTGLAYQAPSPNTFSFNSPYGFCPKCQGFGEVFHLELADLIPDPTRSIAAGGILPLGSQRATTLFNKIDKALTRAGYDISTPIQELPIPLLKRLLYGSGESSFALNSDPGEGTILASLLRGSQRKQAAVDLDRYTQACPDCKGARLSQQALHYRLDGHNIATLTAMPLQELHQWLAGIEERLDTRQNTIAQPILKEVRKRLSLLLDMGLDYLQLGRPLQTLSGGEIQRIRLATQIGSNLVGILYLCDEPSIGLHQRDNQRLIDALKHLRDLGNTVVVIEHDEETMRQADYLLDIGPGAGKHGGTIIAQGTPHTFVKQQSVTADYLTGKRTIPLPSQRRKPSRGTLTLYGCRGHNLQDLTVALPLSTLICVTGVSGSGKSTLIHRTLLPILQRHLLGDHHKQPLPYSHAKGLSDIDKVLAVDQTPIGRTPRSNPATYTGLFSPIRTLFAELPTAKVRGYKPGRFSFNVKGGRCNTCEGAGIKLVTMGFLPSVRIPCEHCRTKRYNRETLEIKYRGKSIADILDMSIEEAALFFAHHTTIQPKLVALQAVGIGYLTLGQHATTLSGGEAQRVKLATELARKQTGKTLYIFDEPTRGLHFQDIAKLLTVFQELVNKGNTVIVIEHNLDVIKVADHLLDLGPEAGSGGGTIVAQGTPEEVAKVKASHTGRYLKPLLPHKRR